MALGARSHTYVLALQTRVIQSVAEEGFSGSESIAVGEDLMIHQRPTQGNKGQSQRRKKTGVLSEASYLSPQAALRAR